MEIKNLNKNLKDIFKHKYIVPLYQRNYAWSTDEIGQLLVDLYENFSRNRKGNYFIGSLVVLKRKDGFLEVIDGQQRLTTLTLLSRILEVSFLSEPRLFYESRPEVEAFFDIFYSTGQTYDVTFNHTVSHLIDAVDIIKETNVTNDSKEQTCILEIDEFPEFLEYFTHKVILVKVEIPEDTDVASYFEIMNNRGQQLQKHEVLKAMMMENIKDASGNYDMNRQKVFSKIWDACSQIDIPIQKLFAFEDRKLLFGEGFDEYKGLEGYEAYLALEENSELGMNGKTSFTIDDILLDNTEFSKNSSLIVDVDDDSEDKSIIDFPNFLMHILKLEYNQEYNSLNFEAEATGIPLNEKDLLDTYKIIKDKVDSFKFIRRLLFYRIVFDRFVIKSSLDDREEDSYRWSLVKPYKYYYEARKSSVLKFKNSFDGQDRLIKSLSMLQVTFRNRKYKNWLQDLLGQFSEAEDLNVCSDLFQEWIEDIILDFYQENFNKIGSAFPFNEGTRTPHFIFNFIDYLLWVENTQLFKFDFKYRNSVEHHFPQSLSENGIAEWLDNLGNLCLVSKSSNSKMNNEHPVGKSEKYYKVNLPPKQKLIYDMTRAEREWGKKQIVEHYNQITELLSNRISIITK